MTPFLPVSAYLDAPLGPVSPLAGEARADVAIVGGGLTGLSTALALRSAGADVVVLEREFCGFGASGRNAGHLTPTIGKDLPTLLMLYGEQRTAAIVRFAEHCVRRTEERIDRLGIDCDYNATGNLMAVVHPRQEKRLRRAAEVAAKVGADVSFIDEQEARRRGLPPAFLCGVLEASGGTLDPGKLIRGMRQAAVGAGVRIHEGTRVLRIEAGSQPVVILERGTVRAEHVVLASNAWTREIAPAGRRVLPLYVTLFESAPLREEQIASIGGWPQREGIYTAHELLESYRLTRRRTIVGGSKLPQYCFGARPGSHGGPNAKRQRILERAFRDRFPTLGDVPIESFWGGWVAMTTNFLPSLGGGGSSGNVWHALGYNGHGVAVATAVGEMLADALRGKPSEWRDALPGGAFPIPPEPLPWAVVNGLLALFHGIDRVTDARARSRGR